MAMIEIYWTRNRYRDEAGEMEELKRRRLK